MTDLRIVRPSKTLFWPDKYGWSEKDRVRGTPGYIVDLDAPLERDWCEGQLYKLAAAPAGSVPSEIKSPKAARDLREFEKAASGHDPKAALKAKADDAGIMDPEPVGGMSVAAMLSDSMVQGAATLAGDGPMLRPTEDQAAAMPKELQEAVTKPKPKPRKTLGEDESEG